MTGPATTVLLLALCFVLTPAECASASTPKLWHLANDLTYFVKTGNFTQVGHCSTPSCCRCCCAIHSMMAATYSRSSSVVSDILLMT
jgi:hypothetical protein